MRQLQLLGRCGRRKGCPETRVESQGREDNRKRQCEGKWHNVQIGWQVGHLQSEKERAREEPGRAQLEATVCDGEVMAGCVQTMWPAIREHKAIVFPSPLNRSP